MTNYLLADNGGGRVVWPASGLQMYAQLANVHSQPLFNTEHGCDCLVCMLLRNSQLTKRQPPTLTQLLRKLQRHRPALQAKAAGVAAPVQSDATQIGGVPPKPAPQKSKKSPQTGAFPQIEDAVEASPSPVTWILYSGGAANGTARVVLVARRG